MDEQGGRLKKNIFKILIIVVCFVAILLLAVKTPKLPDVQDTPQLAEDEDGQGITGDESGTAEELSGITDVTETIELVNNPKLRILITTADFVGNVHETVKVTSNEAFKLMGEDGTVFAEYNAWEIIDLDDYDLKTDENLIFESEGQMQILSLQRAQGTPSYYGSLQIYKESTGYSIINVVPMEDYLLTVVPSEMPSTYPLEALKAQAICARSYAYHHVINASGLPREANMNDSTDYQVYNNIQETESTTQAIKETEGMILTRDGIPVSTYFFSTSCGFTTDETIWKEYFAGVDSETNEELKMVYQAGQKSEPAEVVFYPVAVAKDSAVETFSTDSGLGILYTADALSEENNFRAYLQSDTKDFLEAEEQWYRWTYSGSITPEEIQERLSARYAVRPDLILTYDEDNDNYVNQTIGTVGKIINIEIIKRLDGGVADELLIETEKDSYLVIGEYNIRYVLSDGISEVIRNDGSAVGVSNLLPSAYFIIEPESTASGAVETIYLTGGGYGHGVGMSQNGAKQAALQGMTCEEILALFYGGLELAEVK